jgi:hypothetical protein
MNQPPDPPHGGADEALIEIAADQLEEEAAPFNQITQKVLSGNPAGHARFEQYQFIQ